jgi:bifunctional UDP-N-acetylglucosamine pyrophosphorylase/glucosamine-1-phosphate N-acetyltransferase
VIGDGATVGPFSYLRPGTSSARRQDRRLRRDQERQIGDGAKVPHLSYVGDAEIGEGSNIGAGTIFANYDGVTKHRTTVGKPHQDRLQQHLRRPGRIGDDAMTGGGTSYAATSPPGALAVSADRSATSRAGKRQAAVARPRQAAAPTARAVFVRRDGTDPGFRGSTE